MTKNMKFFRKLKRKLNNNKGETIAEVLIALLVSCLGVALMASMISVSMSIIVNSKKTMSDYISRENVLIEKDAAESGTGTVSVKKQDGAALKLTAEDDGNPLAVKYYVNTVLGNKKVYTYRIKPPDGA